MIVRGSSFASHKVVVTGNVCIWVGTEGVLGKLHDLLIKHGKKRVGRGSALERRSQLLPSCWARLRASLTPARLCHALENIPNGTLLGLPGSGDTPQRWPVTSPSFQPVTRTSKCFSDTPQLLPCPSIKALSGERFAPQSPQLSPSNAPPAQH